MNEPSAYTNVCPAHFFDKHEPFFPCMVGVTVIEKGGRSPSFKRKFSFCEKELDHIIEYAIYWDFDIQHLYELEHVWVYVGKDGSVLDCEASFHGRFFKGLFPDRRNLIEKTHVRLYSQPGKHAFLPDAELFHLIPNLFACTDAEAGVDGLTIPFFYQDILETNLETDQLIRHYMQRFRFTPTMQFDYFELKNDLFRPWEEVYEEIPKRIRYWLAEMKKG
ncbi:hypothetical protein [Bacillus sp. JCM 19034]|uniref:hypothetical protein n=1 Tax=Bacillus sp. JCM 19034 TaxID=1481928 RepID=UPI0007846F2B|nr:hypothetical protein [Bacillus sp. JCM 19034]